MTTNIQSQTIEMPVFFIAHGSPMNALETNFFVEDWLRLHKDTPTPEAIVVFSAHWYTSKTLITDNNSPKTIHDFSGFPEQLYRQNYPAPGSPALAKNIVGTMLNCGFSAQLDGNWGLDHGTWVVLKHLYPEADIPVIQMSIEQNNADPMHAIRIGQSLQEYRKKGILFTGSGNIVHNIPKWMQSNENSPIDWAVEFDNAVEKALIKRDWQSLAHYQQLPFANDAVPTAEHYLPLLYCAGLSHDNDDIRFSNFGESNLATACSRSVRFG